MDSTFGRVTMGGRFLNGQHGEAKGRIRTRFMRLGIPLASPPVWKHLLLWGSFTSSLRPQLGGASHCASVLSCVFFKIHLCVALLLKLIPRHTPLARVASCCSRSPYNTESGKRFFLIKPNCQIGECGAAGQYSSVDRVPSSGEVTHHTRSLSHPRVTERRNPWKRLPFVIKIVLWLCPHDVPKASGMNRAHTPSIFSFN